MDDANQVRPTSPRARRQALRRLLMVIAVMLAALPVTVLQAHADTSGWFPAYPDFYLGDNGHRFTVSAGGCTLTADFKVISDLGQIVQIDTTGDGFPACWPTNGTTSHMQLELEFFNWDFAQTSTSPFTIYTESVTPGYDSEFVRVLGNDIINMHGLTLVKMWLWASSEDYSSHDQVTVPFDTRMCNRSTSRPDLPTIDCGQQPNITVNDDMASALPPPQRPAWQNALKLPGTNGNVTSLSCASAGNCSAGGSYTDSSGARKALVADEVNGAWQPAIEVPGTDALSTGPGSLASVGPVSCASAGNCSAGGYYTDSARNDQAFVVSEVNGSWQPAIEVPGTAALNTGVYAAVTSVSCASAGNCSAGGRYTDSRAGKSKAFVADEVNGVWQTAMEVPGIAALTKPAGYANINSVSCTVAGYCSAGGYYDDSSGNRQAFVVDEVNGTWQTGIEVPGIAALNTYTGSRFGAEAVVQSVSCTLPGNCSAGGYYTDSSETFQPFVVNEVSGTWQTAMQVPSAAALNTGSGPAVLHDHGGLLFGWRGRRELRSGHRYISQSMSSFLVGLRAPVRRRAWPRCSAHGVQRRHDGQHHDRGPVW